MKQNDGLSTDDLARRGDEQSRGRSEEQMVNRGMAEPKYSDVPEAPRAEAPQAAAQPRGHGRASEPQPRSDQKVPLFAGDEAGRFRQRWSDIQAGFVDEPRKAAQQADSLVAETMQRLAQEFANARQQLEQQWDRGEGVTTEDLRVALQRYRAFFDRLLAV
jgi:hypothetical protein